MSTPTNDDTGELAADLDISYIAAVEELDAILRGLEGDNVDVDVLAESVNRASMLINHCRGRIDRARLEVEQVVTSIADTARRPDEEGGDGLHPDGATADTADRPSESTSG